MIYLFIALWIVCFVSSYILNRNRFRKKYHEWTRGDRNFSLFAGIIMAPLCLIVELLFCIKYDSSKPSKW